MSVEGEVGGYGGRSEDSPRVECFTHQEDVLSIRKMLKKTLGRSSDWVHQKYWKRGR
ncbi:hypothetical protein M758_7G045000 [Ceratodon purpureus]|nr:hypothetical protein M758_7G045000 [Ceratodon purpureus]